MAKSLSRRLVSIGVAIIVALVVSLVWNRAQDRIDRAKAPKVGECVEMTGTPNAPDHKERACDDAKAAYKVVADGGECAPPPLEFNYVLARGSDDDDPLADVCLDLNATQGDCFVDSTPERFVAKVRCADSKANPDAFRVVTVGKPGDPCVNGSQPRENEKRGTLLCLGAVS